METMPEEKKKPKELQKMSYMQLVQYAHRIGLSNVAGMTHRELLFELGGSPEGTAVYDRKHFYDPEDIRTERDANRQVPGRTIFWEKDREAVEKIIGRNQWAFNNYDLTDPNKPIKFIFKRMKNVTCNQGHEMVLPKDTDRVVCMECKRAGKESQVIYVNPDEEI